MNKIKGMIDNRKVKDNHKKGIDRVKDVHKEMDKGYGGKMGTRNKENYKRSKSGMTPRRG